MANSLHHHLMALTLAAATMCALPSTAHTYNVYTRRNRVHETMAEQSAACFADARESGDPVTNCADHLALTRKVENRSMDGNEIEGIRFDDVPFTHRAAKIAVRWPDDPQRKLRGARGIRSAANFGAAFRIFRYCSRYHGKDVYEMGLLCASHYGDMQFLHAMASSPTETTAETREKIITWARFAYDYATEEIGDGEPLCHALRDYAPIRMALIGSEDSKICTGTPGRFDPRTVGEHFGFVCTKTFSSKVCYVGTSLFERRAAAIGAIFHLIQDSYSQSHAQRGRCSNEKGKPQATIRLAPIERFLDYAQQNGRDHAVSDQWPTAQALDPEIDHPVVAGARVLEMLADGRTSDDLAHYLDTRVFRLARPLEHDGPGPGECYHKGRKTP